MKILVANRNYHITGGPEKYMFSLMDNMPQHNFIPFCVDFEQNNPTPFKKYFVSPPSGSGGVYYNDFKMSSMQKAAYAINSIYHREARSKLEALLTNEKPDVALFLNAVYFSDSIIDACRKHNVPIVWRMSDFHKVCASYLLYRDGHVCDECLEHGLSRALRNRCGGYQRSLGAALVKVAGMRLSRFRRLYKHVDFFLTPSAFTREKLIQGGLPPDKIIHVPTWTAIPELSDASLPHAPTILYVGRLSHEKGVETLLEAFEQLENEQAKLVIVGDDSSAYAQQLKQSVSSRSAHRVHFSGYKNQQQIAEYYRTSTCFVVPSVWYENQPNVALEGMSHALPLVVSDLGSLRELVVEGKTGYRFVPGNVQDLAEKLKKLLKFPEEARNMGLQARQYVAQHHSMASHLSSLDALFETCLKKKTSC